MIAIAIVLSTVIYVSGNSYEPSTVNYGVVIDKFTGKMTRNL